MSNTIELINARHVIYIDRFFNGESLHAVEREQKSKVYKTYTFHSASGPKVGVKVWNTRLNKMVEVDNRYIVSIVD